jgi:MvaI/BcnI restriction endonuclease family
VIDSISKLAMMMGGDKSTRLFAKLLAPNDNSKNQVYLGEGFSALNLLPHGPVETDDSDLAGSVRDRAKANLNFSWVSESGRSVAPNAKLILYPKYPEVRMSGFLQGCEDAPSEIMTSREAGRVLFLGVLPDGRILAFAVFASHPSAIALGKLKDIDQTGVFLDLSNYDRVGASSRDELLTKLCSIHCKGWIDSQKMGADGYPAPYEARNGGGYTLESELGISPNSRSLPDYLGWEVKQFGVDDFTNNRAKSPVTLMTPEPDGGEYRTLGVQGFLRRYGYNDKSGKADRINFGGRYLNDASFHADTGLALRLVGYDASTQKITDMNGGIILLSDADTIAAQWNFASLIDHWNRKHAKAVYVPCIQRLAPVRYRFGKNVTICEETDFLLFLRGVASGAIYLDPGIKMENADTPKPLIKRRNQFRVKHSSVVNLYKAHSVVNACQPSV